MLFIFLVFSFYHLHTCSKRKRNISLSTESRSNYSKKPFIRECKFLLKSLSDVIKRFYVRAVKASACAAKEGSGFTHASHTTSIIPNEVRKKGAGDISYDVSPLAFCRDYPPNGTVLRCSTRRYQGIIENN